LKCFCGLPATRLIVYICHQKHLNEITYCDHCNNLTMDNYATNKMVGCPHCGYTRGLAKTIPLPKSYQPPSLPALTQLAKQAAVDTSRLSQGIITLQEAIEQLNLMLPEHTRETAQTIRTLTETTAALISKRQCPDTIPCENHCGTGPCSRKCRVCCRLAWTATLPCPACPDQLTEESHRANIQANQEK
jgi:hypothetical protein